MRLALVLTALLVTSTAAFAEDTCKQQSDAKKLAGAAQKSFMTKCEKDAKAACETQAGDKKLAGAAKTSFVKKCATDAVGM
ncbi:MAG: hypothetical protein U1E62_16640 [Alsobacter sp.]